MDATTVWHKKAHAKVSPAFLFVRGATMIFMLGARMYYRQVELAFENPTRSPWHHTTGCSDLSSCFNDWEASSGKSKAPSTLWVPLSEGKQFCTSQCCHHSLTWLKAPYRACVSFTYDATKVRDHTQSAFVRLSNDLEWLQLRSNPTKESKRSRFMQSVWYTISIHKSPSSIQYLSFVRATFSGDLCSISQRFCCTE